MNRARPAPGDDDAREVRRSLDSAADEQITRVVALVDAMAERGRADALIEPLRPRLAQLRPSRVPSFGRLLFAPLDPVIQPAPVWRRGVLGIPRSALGCLGTAVRAVLGDEARRVEAILRDGQTDSARAYCLAGCEIWPKASRVLRGLVVPPSWTADTGLGDPDFQVIRGACAAVLEAASGIEDLASDQARGRPVEPPALSALVACATDAFEAGVLVAVMLSRVPAIGAVLQAAADAARLLPDATRGAALDQAVEFQLNAMEKSDPSKRSVAQATADASLVAALLDALDQPGPAFRISRKPRADALRRKADAAHRARFTAELEGRVMATAEALTAQASDAEVSGVETGLRTLRRYEGAARQLGGGEQYDKLLRSAGQKASSLALPLVDRARLVEILQGSEQAMALLTGG